MALRHQQAPSPCGSTGCGEVPAALGKSAADAWVLALRWTLACHRMTPAAYVAPVSVGEIPADRVPITYRWPLWTPTGWHRSPGRPAERAGNGAKSASRGRQPPPSSAVASGPMVVPHHQILASPDAEAAAD